jgi:PKD repeat protein
MMSSAEHVFFYRPAVSRCIWTFICLLALLISNVYAAQVPLTWQDPNNDPTEVGGYNLYYWQTNWDMPASVNVGKQTTYTLTDLEAGQTYHFAVTAHDGNGGRESIYSNEVSKTFPASTPVASFTMNPTAGIAPLLVAFTNTSGGSITSWAWDFGDGSTSSQQHPNHTYLAGGTSTVRLTVTGPDGSDTVTKTLSVSSQTNNLVAAFSFDEGSGTTIADASGTASNGTISGATWASQGKYGKALSFDGVNDWVTVSDTSSLDLTHSMTIEAWVYPTVAPTGWRTIVVKEQSGGVVYYLHASSASNQPATGVFIGAEQRLQGGSRLAANTWTHLAATYDGTRQRLYINGIEVANRPQTGQIQTSNSPLHIGGNSVWGEYFQGRIDEVRIYNRALSAVEIQADMNTPVGTPASDTQPPAISVTAPANGAVVSGTSVTVSASASDNVGVVGVQFLLNGANLGSEDTTAPYSTTWNTTTVVNGTYSLAAVARDAAGNQTTATVVSVTVNNLPPAPVAAFSATPTSGSAPLAVQFTDQSTGSITLRQWAFGTGATSTATNPAHTYTTPSTYTVTLTVTGPGGSHSTSKAITVTAPAPVAAFSAAPTSGSAPLAVKFNDQSTGSITSRQWAFGTGVTSTATNPSHTYTTPGTYTVTLTVTGPGGSHSASKSISVNGGKDTDGDGLADADEAKYGTNPAVADTDGDKIKDGDEVDFWGANWNVNYDNDAIANNLLDSDADNDGYVDGLEIYYGSDPADPTSIPLLPDLMTKSEVQVDHTWKRVTFAVPFLDPVVVATPLSHKDGAPAVVRLRNVNATGFDIRLQEWGYQDGIHAAETVGYLVMERGHHILSDGTHVEVDTVDTAKTSFSTVSFKQPFNVAPVVITSVASFNEAEAVTGRVREASPTSFQYLLQEQELNTRVHAKETVAYIAWEPSAGPIDGLTVEVNKTPDAVLHTFYRIVFTTSFSDTPVLLADMQTTDGSDTANLRWQNKTSKGVDIKVAEEQSKDSETTHTKEVVGFIAIR